MQNFHNILYVSHATGDEDSGLLQALAIARNNHAAVKVLVVCPAIPEDFEDYSQLCMDALAQRVQQSLNTVRERLNLAEDQLALEVETDCGSRPAERVIHRVLDDGYDLVIKNVEGRNRRKGFKAMDMELLRKCPCPVWLCRPITDSHKKIDVAVAVDPECDEASAYDLAIRLLRWSRTLADTCSGELHIISCWDYDVDEYLRHNFPLSASDEELDKATEAARSKHRSKLDVLIHASGIGGKLDINHAIARPDRYIPLLIEEKKFDILVMGTVGRTGIPGFIMGNTAENILQKISCSLLALKPGDFVSPVREGSD
ncbi:Nucleotide-binding universal stress protein, UspA family [Microbulbifer donghaiensis]|uniref:Nucleotide-binding universal stress protein, UspA family n=1 Tax=Microbulbifer donghaiensis TaxID=494016 RepID=A0A1M5G1X9_9GAMM|nr:universal stress protein [Microbulbifer donghaiensis]SHF97644.1 Nucleotide-binding universal stress protein, UspA family [Microbulbifer donghaiensis]